MPSHDNDTLGAVLWSAAVMSALVLFFPRLFKNSHDLIFKQLILIHFSQYETGGTASTSGSQVWVWKGR